MSLLAQGVWASVLILLPSSSFASLLGYFGAASWFYFALACSSVIYLRIKQPQRHRPYRLSFYPFPVILVIVIALIIIVSSFATEFLYTSIAFGFIFLSFPVHFVLEKCGWITSQYPLSPSSETEETKQEGFDIGNQEEVATLHPILLLNDGSKPEYIELPTNNY